MFVIWLPNQWSLDSTVNTDVTNQGNIERDLTHLVEAGAFKPLCGPIAVPNHRAVPRLAFGLDIKPTQIISASEQRIPRHGYFVDPASSFVIHNYILDPNDPTRFWLSPPRGFHFVTQQPVVEGLPALPLRSGKRSATSGWPSAPPIPSPPRRPG